MESSSYKSLYRQMKCIGRGNYGSAYLIERIQDKQLFLGKKIAMDMLSEKEKEDAVNEATMLKSLNHPNIVSYYNSYMDSNQLIIVMQYCEVGDLAYHLKKRKDKNNYFTEAEIMNWFVQICLALQYIHSRKVLHRDIKSSNIFLTGNNTVKLGDFGISRVLTNSVQAANTVVGTPYYMSPEICQNKPYNFKSDVWSLGCVLYELCTLNRAFTADNLLGLVYKIVQDKYEPIPAHYSKELAQILTMLLTKDETKRPHVIEILRMPFVSQKMKQFVESRGLQTMDKTLTIRRAIPVGFEGASGEIERKATVAIQREKKKEEDKYAGLTPKQRKDLKRQEESDRRAQELKMASKQVYADKLKAKQRKEAQFIGTLSTVSEKSDAEGTDESGGVMAKKQSIQLFETPAQPHGLAGTTGTDFDANDRTTDTFALSDTLESLQEGPGEIDVNLSTQEARFSNYSPESKKSGKLPTQDLRPITGTGTYDLTKLDLPESDEDQYSDDFEDLDTTNERPLASQDEAELKEVLGVYAEELQRQQTSPTPPESPSPIKKSSKAEEIPPPPIISSSSRITALREKAESVLGKGTFKQVYDYLKEQYNKGTDNRLVRAKLKEGLGGHKEKLDACFLIDQILFLEMAS